MTKEIPACYGDFTTSPSLYHARGCNTCPRHDDCVMIVRHSDDRITLTLDEIVGIGVQAPASSHQEGGTHYQEMGVQPWDVIDTWPLEQQIGFHRGTALAYLMRMGTKAGQDPVTEIKKARHCSDKLIEVLGGAS
jgi:hypothetical protein